MPAATSAPSVGILGHDEAITLVFALGIAGDHQVVNGQMTLEEGPKVILGRLEAHVPDEDLEHLRHGHTLLATWATPLPLTLFNTSAWFSPLVVPWSHPGLCP